jgi:hypothetical protein
MNCVYGGASQTVRAVAVSGKRRSELSLDVLIQMWLPGRSFSGRRWIYLRGLKPLVRRTRGAAMSLEGMKGKARLEAPEEPD